MVPGLESHWPPPSPASTPSQWERRRRSWRTGRATLICSVSAPRPRPPPAVVSSSHWGRTMNHSAWATPPVPPRLRHLSITQVLIMTVRVWECPDHLCLFVHLIPQGVNISYSILPLWALIDTRNFDDWEIYKFWKYSENILQIFYWPLPLLSSPGQQTAYKCSS